MIQIKGKYCKDCKIFTDSIESEALSMVYHFLDHPMSEGSKIRIMPDVHAGKDIVVADYSTIERSIREHVKFGMPFMRSRSMM